MNEKIKNWKNKKSKKYWNKFIKKDKNVKTNKNINNMIKNTNSFHLISSNFYEEFQKKNKKKRYWKFFPKLEHEHVRKVYQNVSPCPTLFIKIFLRFVFVPSVCYFITAKMAHRYRWRFSRFARLRPVSYLQEAVEPFCHNNP